MLKNPNVQGVLVLSSVAIIASLYILGNQQPTKRVAAPAPLTTPTEIYLEEWQVQVQTQLEAVPTNTSLPTQPSSTPVPSATIGIQQTGFDANNLPQTASPTTIIETPLFVGGTPLPAPTQLEIAGVPAQNPEQYQLPAEMIPLSAQPFDHFYLTRPIDVSANSEYLYYYPYGSTGLYGWRVHHGLDIGNPTGQEVRAAGSGVVTFADRASETGEFQDNDRVGDLEVYESYGNFVVIEHDFGWQGQKVWTLYAHLSAIMVTVGQRVEMSDIIGLVGSTGNATGPHVHFEVRIGTDSYFSTRNPILWMAPYLGHGIVIGRVVDKEGRFIENALIQLNRDGRRTDSTTTYINAYVDGKRVWNVVPDDNWNENFAMGDIAAGDYQIVVLVNGERYFKNIKVQAGISTFIEFQIDTAATPQFADPSLYTPIVATAIPVTAIPSPTPQ